MFLRVALDPDAGPEILQSRSRIPGAILVRYLRERCLISLDAQTSVGSILSSLDGPGLTELRAVFVELLQSRSVRYPDVTAVPIGDCETAEQTATWSELADLLLLAAYRMDEIDPRRASRLRPELSTLGDMLHTDTAAMVDELWAQFVAAGTSRERAWATVFEPFARTATRVVVIDAYAAIGIYRGLNAGRGRHHDGGPVWFLQHLHRSRIREIRLFSSSRALDGHRADAVAERIHGWWSGLGGGGARLRLHLVDGDFDHARRLAFEGWAGFELHKGLASFDAPRLREGITIAPSLALAHQVQAQARALQAR